MKKLITILLILSLLMVALSSCKKKEVLEKPIIVNEVDIKSESELESIGIYLADDEYLRMPDEYLVQWEQQLSAASKITVDIAYIDKQIDENSVLPFIEGLDKLVYFNDLSLLKYLIAEDLVVPLNDYLAEIKESKNIDQSYYENFTDEYGTIYALPAFREVNYIGPRTYNATWLLELGMTVPKNIDEFTKLAIKIRGNNVGTDGREGYIADIYSYSNFTTSFMDIMLAFGCKPSIVYAPNIFYNPEKNKYEDMVMSENFKNAITYIKYLQENDLIINTEGMSWEDKENKYDIGWSMEDPLELGFYLEGDSRDNLLYEAMYFGGFAVLKDCKDAKEKLSFLINRVFVEEDILESINYGVRGYNFDEETKYYYRITKNEDDSWRPYPRMNVNIINELNESKPIYYSKEEYLNNSENYDNIKKQNLLYIEEVTALKSKEANIIFEFDYSKEIKFNKGSMINKINNSFVTLIRDVFSNDISVDEAIESYQQKYINDGYIEYIDELNGY